MWWDEGEMSDGGIGLLLVVLCAVSTSMTFDDVNLQVT